ncbi:expressed unknown protein [Seminavis robusta]|uniref:Uncharacterized protein n=1 Tax=Seminavis robusta TaxID=568900 RepID=A0A9N8EF48_9STRA|nr:expressed unknown protein [Seminavis robusta]|eukprot:Sro909_g218910.1 n/a (98) ;mRNA; f:8597-8890
MTCSNCTAVTPSNTFVASGSSQRSLQQEPVIGAELRVPLCRLLINTLDLTGCPACQVRRQHPEAQPHALRQEQPIMDINAVQAALQDVLDLIDGEEF